MIRWALVLLAAIACSADDPWYRQTCGDVPPLGVGHSVQPPQLLHRVDPAWPETKLRGVVIIQTVIDERGAVCAARVVKSLSDELDPIALAAVKQWRFRPALLRGEPRAAFYHVSVRV